MLAEISLRSYHIVSTISTAIASQAFSVDIACRVFSHRGTGPCDLG